jgi:hypothetical protein
MRSAAIAGVLAALALGAGCGGSDSGSSAEADAVASVYTTYINAVKAGDGKTACQQLTPTYQRQAAKLTTPTAHAKVRGASCARAISIGTLRSVLRKFEPKLERVQVNGARASGFQPGEGALGPQKVLFRRLGGGWKIAATIYQKGGPKIGA